MKRIVVVAVVFTAVFVAASLGGAFQQAGDVDADETVTKVDVDENGDAVFTLEIRTRLDTDEKREAFDSFADEVEDDPDAAVADFRVSIESLVDRARDETGREMSVSDFTVETRSEPLPVERGIVEYRFDWDGFASANDAVEAGDVLSGYILGDSDALVFRYPDGYEVDSVEPSPDIDEDGLRWDGPRDFDDDQPRAVFVPVDPEAPADDTDDTDDALTENGDEAEAIGAPLYVYALVLIAILAVALFAYRRNGDDEAPEPPSKGPPEPASEPAPEPEPEPEPSFEDLPDEERVLRIIESEDGRMKQKHLVERTGWSEAKVSQVTSRLEDADEITKLRMGRENIIELQEDDGEDDEPSI